MSGSHHSGLHNSWPHSICHALLCPVCKHLNQHTRMVTYYRPGSWGGQKGGLLVCSSWLSQSWSSGVPSIAVGFVIVFIPMVTLLLYPNCYKCLAIMKIPETVYSRSICRMLPLDKLKPLLDSFQGCFKDNCRWFAGLYLLYRVLIVLNMYLISTENFYLTLEIQLILMLLVHAVIQPYKRRRHNIIDFFLFANMAVINAISMFNFRQAQLLHGVSTVFQVFQILLPLLCVVLYLCYNVLKTLTLSAWSCDLEINSQAVPICLIVVICLLRGLSQKESCPCHSPVPHWQIGTTLLDIEVTCAQKYICNSVCIAF